MQFFHRREDSALPGWVALSYPYSSLGWFIHSLDRSSTFPWFLLLVHVVLEMQSEGVSSVHQVCRSLDLSKVNFSCLRPLCFNNA
jgi:hypothetical protein